MDDEDGLAGDLPLAKGLIKRNWKESWNQDYGLKNSGGFRCELDEGYALSGREGQVASFVRSDSRRHKPVLSCPRVFGCVHVKLHTGGCARATNKQERGKRGNGACACSIVCNTGIKNNQGR